MRAGLRVCPERNEWRLKEAHFTAQAQCFMTLVHLWVTMFHVKCLEKSAGKWTLCGLHACRPFPVFHCFGESGVFVWYNGLTYINPKWNPSRSMVNCSMGPEYFMTCIHPKWNPNRSMDTCSMGPGDLIIWIKPKWNPNRNIVNCSMGPGDFPMGWWLLGPPSGMAPRVCPFGPYLILRVCPSSCG